MPLVKTLSRSNQQNQMKEDNNFSVSTSTSNNVFTPLPSSRSRRTSCLEQPDQPCVASKMPISELSMGAALGNKESCRPLDKTTERRKEDWITLIKSVAAEYAVSDPVDTTNTDSSPSASGNVGKDGDLNEASELSQNQSKF